ncbi:HAL/PAL/TAL family ammonia-lyase [Rhizobium sp. CFBP 8762]|uniref:HAL/PAL/TAL family ammonia-lyase n=1 Tax=Rhizobium sp. CFBP 8762 TaxID=2775279 RepID=UPI00313C27DF
MRTVILDGTLDWRDIARVADGATLELSPAARKRVERASQIVSAIVERGVRAYGVNTGVGALSDTVVDRASQSRLSRNIIRSHACGVGPALAAPSVRAIMAAQTNNFAHGYSGVRIDIVDHLATLLAMDCLPMMPSKGSAGYLTHNAHTALVLIGEGRAQVGGQEVTGAQALAAAGLSPLVLQAKEGLSLVNGTACATGLACVALKQAEHLLDWADASAALTLEALRCQITAIQDEVLALRPSAGIAFVGGRLRAVLYGSGLIAKASGIRTQDALSLRAIPHAHGAARDVFAETCRVVNQELASVTDNPAVSGTPDAPVVSSQAHAVAPALAMAMDSLAIAMAQIAAMSERRIDRLVNPLVSGLPPFLATDPGANSGFMIAQYTAAALSAENRRLAAPASLDGGLTSGLQEDFLAHPTASANKLLSLIDNARQIFAIELCGAAQAQDFLADEDRAVGTNALYTQVRGITKSYEDDRPLGPELERVCVAMSTQHPAFADSSSTPDVWGEV